MSPEFLGDHFQKALLQAGAIDFSIIQQLMKKGRPGFLLRVLLTEEHLDSVSSFLFTHTSTIGLRYQEVKRKELDRKLEIYSTPFGDIQVKESRLPNEDRKRKPENDDIQRLAQEHGISPIQLLQALNLNQPDSQEKT